jgi:hypothetical protein
MTVSQSAHPGASGSFRFEFDSVNHVLMARFEGRITEELVVEFDRALRACWAETSARAGILDVSLVTEIPLSSDTIRHLARQDPAPEVAGKPRVVVAPRTDAFGLGRMFQLAGEAKRPLFQVVRTMDEAYTMLGIQSPQFEPFELRRAS